MTKKIILSVVIVLVIAAAGWGIWKNKHQAQPAPAKTAAQVQQPAHQFFGTLTKIDGNTIDANGTTVFDNTQLNPVARQSFTITLSPDVKIQKTVVHLPTAAEQKAMGGSWTQSELKKDVTMVDLATLQTDMASYTPLDITVKSAQDIGQAHAFQASEIDYAIPLSPE